MDGDTSSTVVLVDDNDDDVFFFARLLKQTGITNRVLVFMSGEEAIAYFMRATRPGGDAELPLLCFLDVKMPGLNGFDVLQWIRSVDALSRVPVVMLSSSDDFWDINRAAQLGAQCYLTKFPSPATLRDVFEEGKRHPQTRDRERALFGCASNLLVPQS